jgi:hypothetical protein
MGYHTDHPEGRYCGDQMCCWGPGGKKVPVAYEHPKRPVKAKKGREK